MNTKSSKFVAAFFLGAGMLASSPAVAEFPNRFQCTGIASDGEKVAASLTFVKDPAEIYPPRYEVRIALSPAKDGATENPNPYEPVSNTDPRPQASELQIRRFDVRGAQDFHNPDRIVFGSEPGYVEQVVSPFSLTLDIGGRTYHFDSCVVPEGGFTVGN